MSVGGKCGKKIRDIDRDGKNSVYNDADLDRERA